MLSHFEMLVFTYCGEDLFDVSAFDGRCVEKEIVDSDFHVGK